MAVADAGGAPPPAAPDGHWLRSVPAAGAAGAGQVGRGTAYGQAISRTVGLGNSLAPACRTLSAVVPVGAHQSHSDGRAQRRAIADRIHHKKWLGRRTAASAGRRIPTRTAFGSLQGFPARC